MNAIEYTENELKAYNAMYRAIKHAEYKIALLMDKTAPKEIKASCMDATGIRGGNKAGNTLDDMLELNYWKGIIDDNQAALDRINNVLEEIGKETKMPVQEVLSRLYIKNESKKEIAQDLACSEVYVYKIREAGLRLLTISMIGIKAVNII